MGKLCCVGLFGGSVGRLPLSSVPCLRGQSLRTDLLFSFQRSLITAIMLLGVRARSRHDSTDVFLLCLCEGNQIVDRVSWCHGE